MAHGVAHDWMQGNDSFSARKGTLRGLHMQAAPHGQAKLVSVARGRIRDVIVDGRPRSATRGRWTAVELSAEGGEQLLVPAGLLHGFVTLEDDTLVQYLVDGPRVAEAERAVAWDDPALAIDWGGDWPRPPVQSPRDAAAPPLAALGEPS